MSTHTNTPAIMNPWIILNEKDPSMVVIAPDVVDHKTIMDSGKEHIKPGLLAPDFCFPGTVLCLYRNPIDRFCRAYLYAIIDGYDKLSTPFWSNTKHTAYCANLMGVSLRNLASIDPNDFVAKLSLVSDTRSICPAFAPMTLWMPWARSYKIAVQSQVEDALNITWELPDTKEEESKIKNLLSPDSLEKLKQFYSRDEAYVDRLRSRC